jgi:hypothetical protein
MKCIGSAFLYKYRPYNLLVGEKKTHYNHVTPEAKEIIIQLDPSK